MEDLGASVVLSPTVSLGGEAQANAKRATTRMANQAKQDFLLFGHITQDPHRHFHYKGTKYSIVSVSMNWKRKDGNPVVRAITSMLDGEGYTMIVRPSSTSEANARLIGIYVELRDADVKDLNLARIFSQDTPLYNQNTSCNRSKSWLIDSDAKKFRPRAMRGDWSDSSVELETLGKKDSIPQVAVDTSMMQLEGTNEGILDGYIAAERTSNNPHWFQGKSQSVQSGSTLGMAGTCGSINLHLIGG